MTKPLTNVGSHTGAYGPVEWGLTLTIGLIWGSAFLWIAMGVDHLSPGVVAFGRVVLGALALMVFPNARRRIAAEDWLRVGAVALVGNAAPALLFAIAETELDSAVAGMITSGTPILSLIIASILMRSLPPRTQSLGIGLGFAGIVLMTTPSLRGAEAAPIGVGLVLLATIGYGLSGNLLVPLQQRYGGPAVTLWALAVSSVVLAPFALAGLADSEFTASSVIAVLILGVIGTGIARSLAATLAGRAGAPRMSTTTYLIPVVAIALGVIVRDESVSPIAIAGVVVVLAGAIIASRAVGSGQSAQQGGPTTGHVVLTGPMGAGKTTIGGELADRLDLPFHDNDRHIELQHRRTGRQIAAEEGVSALHRMERAFVEDLLRTGRPSVIAAAASIADDPGLLADLVSAGNHLIYLAVDPDRLATRARQGSHRRPIEEDAANDLYARRHAAAVAAGAIVFRVDETDNAAGSIESAIRST